MCSRLRVKDLTVRPIPWAGGFWGGFASVVSIGAERAQSQGQCASSESGTECLAGGLWGSMIGAQPKEERGSSDDANGRHGGSFEIIISIHYKKGATCAPS